MTNEVLEIGGLHGGKHWQCHQQDRVYNTEGISPCIPATGGDTFNPNQRW